MGKAFIQESTLTDIANAIRGKNGSSDTYLPSEMAQAIQNIPSGGGGEPDYFWVKDASGSANTLTIKKSNNALPDKVFDWSLDKQTWTTITITDTTGINISVPANSKVYLRGDNGTLGYSGQGYAININCNSIFNVGGDITTLIIKTGNQLILPERAFTRLFYNSKIKDASQLQLLSTTLGAVCYGEMFYGSLLTTQPQFPNIVKVVGVGQFNSMFSSSKITELVMPDINDNGSSNNCMYLCAYNTSITRVELKQTTETSQWIRSAFDGCSNLSTIILHIQTWNTSNAQNAFQDVSPTGDFYNLGGATIPSGTNGIPSGWTEHTSL